MIISPSMERHHLLGPLFFVFFSSSGALHIIFYVDPLDIVCYVSLCECFLLTRTCRIPDGHRTQAFASIEWTVDQTVVLWASYRIDLKFSIYIFSFPSSRGQ